MNIKHYSENQLNSLKACYSDLHKLWVVNDPLNPCFIIGSGKSKQEAETQAINYISKFNQIYET